MKLRRLKTTAVLLGLSLVVFASCGKKQTTSSVLANGTYTGTCSQATGENVYTGEIVDNMNGDSGSIVLTVLATGGTVYAQSMMTASLSINGRSFCCTSLGSGAVLGNPKTAGEKATIADVPLSCQSSSTDPTFGAYYQAVTLKIGVWCPAGWTEAAITTDQRLKGCIELSSGVQGLSGSGSSNPTYFVQ